LEHRRKPTARNRTRSLDKRAVAKNSPVIPVSLPNIAELITYGEITLGVLVRRRGETLAQLLARLDHAIDQALTEDIYTDEINPPPTHS